MARLTAFRVMVDYAIGTEGWELITECSPRAMKPGENGGIDLIVNSRLVSRGCAACRGVLSMPLEWIFRELCCRSMGSKQSCDQLGSSCDLRA
jgi:hypothetical protein